MNQLLLDNTLLLAVIYTLLIFFAWIDLYRRQNLTIEKKVLWGVFVYILPVIGIALYLILSRKIFKT